MDVSIVTVTYRSADCIAECIASVLRQKGVAAELIVVDNASPDDTAKAVRSFSSRIQFVENRQNVGFGRGCNQGFAASRGRYVFFLNPDAQFVQDDGLAKMCKFMDEHPEAGMAGTSFLGKAGKCSPPSTSYPAPRSARRDLEKLPGKIAWVIAASIIVRREVYEKMGGFDADFFLYSEDTDFCLRLRKLGYEIAYFPEVEVSHIGGQSESNQDPYEVWLRRANGIHLFWKKHFTPLEVATLIRRDKWRAGYRMTVYRLLSLVQAKHSNIWKKHRRYKGIWTSCRRFSIANDK
jgi:GT2 family glycosyltransferase